MLINLCLLWKHEKAWHLCPLKNAYSPTFFFFSKRSWQLFLHINERFPSLLWSVLSRLVMNVSPLSVVGQQVFIGSLYSSCLLLLCFLFLIYLTSMNWSDPTKSNSKWFSNGMKPMMRKELKHVWIPGPLIIGAGPSGLAAAACLKKRGVPSLILEKENCIASLWKLKTYDRLRLHLPKKFCELPYMKFPSEFPVYPTKQQFITYLEDYARSFSIEPMFGQEVLWTKYDRSMGLWQVEAKESRFLCRWLIVATGENAEPVVPDIAGISNFGGRLMHTSTYKNGADFEGSKVLVVGCGNSGMEVSLDLCNTGAQVSLVVRDKVTTPLFHLFVFSFPSMFCFLVTVHTP